MNSALVGLGIACLASPCLAGSLPAPGHHDRAPVAADTAVRAPFEFLLKMQLLQRTSHGQGADEVGGEGEMVVVADKLCPTSGRARGLSYATAHSVLNVAVRPRWNTDQTVTLIVTGRETTPRGQVIRTVRAKHTGRLGERALIPLSGTGYALDVTPNFIYDEAF